MTEVSIESAAFYEWLLSDHLDARAERCRRRAATYQDERERTGKVLAWVSKINATPDAPGTLRDLAESVGPLAANAAARAEAEFATSDEAYVARARANWETYMQVSAPDGSWDYRYPDRYTGPGAAGQPRPDIRPDASGGKDRGPGRRGTTGRTGNRQLTGPQASRKEQRGAGIMKDPEIFADLTTEELRRLGGVLHSGSLTAGAAAGIIGEYDTAMEAAGIAIDLYATARHREQAQAGEPEPQAEAEP